MIARLAWIFGALALGACAEPALEFSGCLRVDDGPTCVIDPEKGAELIIFLEGETAGPTAVALDGAPLDARSVVTAEGVRLETRVDRRGRLSIDGSKRRSILAITDRGRARADDVATGTTARALLRTGRVDEAIALFERSAAGHRKSGARSEAIRDLQACAFALASIAHRPEDARAYLDRVEVLLDGGYAEGRGVQHYFRALIARASADPRRALAELRIAKTRLRRVGLEQLARGVEEVEAPTLEELGRSREARALSRSLADADGVPPCERARRMNNIAWVGLLEADSTDAPPNAETRAALEHAGAAYALEGCRAAAGRELYLLHAALAAVLDRDFDRAALALAQTHAEQPGIEAELWKMELAARIALGRGRGAEAIEILDRAAARARAALQLDAVWRIEVRRGRAWSALDRKREAIAAFEEAERVLDDGMLRLPLLEGRASFLADRSASARELAEVLVAEDAPAAACVLRRSRSRALLRAADGLRVRGLEGARRRDWEAAVAEVRAARAAIEARAAEAWALPGDQRAAHAAETERLIAAMRSRVAAALALVESDASRDEVNANAGSFPAEASVRNHAGGDLAASRGKGVSHACEAPPPGEVMLLYEPPLAFVLSASGVRAHRFLSPPQTPAEWVAPFGAEVAGAARVRLSVRGAAARVRFEEAIEREVVHTLDLSGAALAREDLARAREAVVVADPRRNLKGARREGEVAIDLLQRSGWRVRALEGKDATAIRAIEAIESSALLHYAGHASGAEGEPSDHLELHESALYTEDILALERAPQFVVLDGCSSAKDAADEESPALGLAQAFVLAGAEKVIATREPISDALGSALATELYGSAPRAPLHRTSFQTWVP